MRLVPEPDVFTPHSVLDLMERVSTKHFVQGHVKGKVVEEGVLYTVNAFVPQRR